MKTVRSLTAQEAETLGLGTSLPADEAQRTDAIDVLARAGTPNRFARPTEAEVEGLIERMTDRLDARFMRNEIGQQAYDAEMREINTWADRQWCRPRR